MKPTREEVQEMVAALFTLVEGLERARRRIPDASKLYLLQFIAAHEAISPSEIAKELGVHQSTITRQVRSLEDAGQVVVVANPDDHRSCFISPTEAGRAETQRLNEIGLGRFETFVADWDAEEVRTFTRYLTKLEVSKAAVGRLRRKPGGRRWQKSQ
jgi:DNA-binding MarR family transcriptional regulator